MTWRSQLGNPLESPAASTWAAAAHTVIMTGAGQPQPQVHLPPPSYTTVEPLHSTASALAKCQAAHTPGRIGTAGATAREMGGGHQAVLGSLCPVDGVASGDGGGR